MRKEVNSRVHFRKVKIDSFSLPGKPLDITAFRNCIYSAEMDATVTLNEAKNKWVGKRDYLSIKRIN